MNFLSGLLGGGVKEAGEGVKAGLEGIGQLTQNIRSAITGEITADKKAKILETAQQIETLSLKGIHDTNLAEAQSGSSFRGGWRPAVGWVCAISLFFFYAFRIAVATSLWAYMSGKAHYLLPFPEFSIMEILALVGTLLGSKVIRSNEVIQGVR